MQGPMRGNGSAVTVPNDIGQAGSFLVRTELAITYQLISVGSDFRARRKQPDQHRRKYFFLRAPASSVVCTDC